MRSRICWTGSPREAFTRWVAPKVRPISNLLSSISTATIMSAPAMAQPWMTFSPTPPQPKTAHVEHRTDLGGIDGGADAGHHPAAEQRCLGEGDVGVDQHGGDLGHQGVAGEGAEAGGGAEDLVGARQSRLAGRDRRGEAQRRVATLAHLADATAGAPGQDHVVAGLETRDLAAHGLDDAGALVAEDRREQRVAPFAFEDVPVGVAYAAGHQFDQDLAGAWSGDVDVLDVERRVGRVGDCCLHAGMLGRWLPGGDPHGGFPQREPTGESRRVQLHGTTRRERPQPRERDSARAAPTLGDDTSRATQPGAGQRPEHPTMRADGP